MQRREKQLKHSSICCRVSWRCLEDVFQRGHRRDIWLCAGKLSVVKQHNQVLSLKTSCSLFTASGRLENGHNDCCFLLWFTAYPHSTEITCRRVKGLRVSTYLVWERVRERESGSACPFTVLLLNTCSGWTYDLVCFHVLAPLELYWTAKMSGGRNGEGEDVKANVSDESLTNVIIHTGIKNLILVGWNVS